MFEPPVDPFLNTILDGKYRIVERIAAGGMGHVFLARCADDQSARVVIKVLSPECPEYYCAAFMREAKALSSLDCPGVPRLLSSDIHKDGVSYIVMEYIEGATLDKIHAQAIRNQEHLSITDVVRMMIKICATVGAVHADWVVHRDLKPEHILVRGKLGQDTAQISLLDFGLAVFAAELAEVCAGERDRGVVWGTPEYMSPEQATHSPITHQADIYALGVILYELLTGSLPVTGSGPASILHDKVYGQVRPPEELRLEVSPVLARLTMAVLAIDPRKRPATVAEFQASLARCLEEIETDSQSVR